MGEDQGQAGTEGAGERHPLVPETDLEIVEDKHFLSENVSISGRHFVRCSFNFCNLIYAGGPVGLVACGGAQNRLIEVGPLREALQGAEAEAIKEKMLRYHAAVRQGLHLEARTDLPSGRGLDDAGLDGEGGPESP